MRLYVPLSREEFDRLLAFARAERRRPQDEAATLLAYALSGDLPAYAADLASRAPASRVPPSGRRSSTDDGDPVDALSDGQVNAGSIETKATE